MNSNSSRPVKFVKIGEDHNFYVNKKVLASALQAPNIRDRNIAVISVAGAFRKGKSFLLGFFLRYLYAKYKTKDLKDWLGKSDEVLEGFSWRGGAERHTTGILFWKEIFICDETNTAILLLDTQGVFDGKTTFRECSFIFALSTLLSSVQIYNISDNLRENDLQHLQLFSEYGKLVLENSEHKPFQHLIFLIRDWGSSHVYPYGADGGREYLNSYLKVTDDQHDDLKSIRKHIKECFSELDCFLLPHPGLSVAIDPNFKGELSKIESDFKELIKQLVPSILSPENLRVKKINGTAIRAKDLVMYFNTYAEILGRETLPVPTSIMNATAEANHLSAFDEAMDFYGLEMKKIVGCEKVYKAEEFRENHMNVKRSTLEMFFYKKKMGSLDLTNRYSEKLQDKLDRLFLTYEKANERKYEARRRNLEIKSDCVAYYEREMSKTLNHLIENIELDKLNTMIKNRACEIMQAQFHIEDSKSIDHYKVQLVIEINNKFIYFKEANDENRKKFEDAEDEKSFKKYIEARDIYEEEMRKFFNSSKCEGGVLKIANAFFKNKALEKLNEISYHKNFKNYRETLQADISELMEVLENL